MNVQSVVIGDAPANVRGRFYAKWYPSSAVDPPSLPSIISMKIHHLSLLMLFAIALRLPYFNSPAIHIDEQFYLVVADRWVNQGLVPYVDIWDRKPIGIFAIYAVAVLLFKNAILGYQILATLFVIATCLVVTWIGRILNGPRCAFFAASIYAVAVVLDDGPGGQTPVFYNLLVAGSAALLLKLILQTSSRRNTITILLASAFLLGLALQIKYTCLFEAVVLCLFTLGLLLRRKQLTGPDAVVVAVGMAICGITPTLLVGVAYAAQGHWLEFFDANFKSIFQKNMWNLDAIEWLRRFLLSSVCEFPFLPFVVTGIWIGLRGRGARYPQAAFWFLFLWLAASFGGAVAFGNPSRHYFLATLVPFSFLTTDGLFFVSGSRFAAAKWVRAFPRWMEGYKALVALLLIPVIGSVVMAYTNARQRGERADVLAVGSYLRERQSAGCLFVFNRLPIMYYLSGACVPSKYVFPNHLSEISEVRGTTNSGLPELRRVLNSQPATIFVRRPHTPDTDPEAIQILENALRENYTLVFERDGHLQQYDVYARRAPGGGN
jgi:hypothetical protein